VPAVDSSGGAEVESGIKLCSFESDLEFHPRRVCLATDGRSLARRTSSLCSSQGPGPRDQQRRAAILGMALGGGPLNEPMRLCVGVCGHALVLATLAPTGPRAAASSCSFHALPSAHCRLPL
jgi:hypothetical protein